MDTNASYYLNVKNVQDSFGNAITSSTNAVLPAGLVLFLRGDSGVILDANNNVVQWLDQTTNANNAAQFFGVPSVNLIGSAARPTTNIINNGQWAVDFGNLGSGVNLLHWLQAPSSPSLASMISNTTMYAVADFYSTAGNDLLNKTWGNLPAPFDWDPSAGENVQYGNGFNNAPAGGIGSTIFANTPYVLSSTIQLPTSGGTTNFNFYLNGGNNGSGAIKGVTGNPPGIYDGGQPVWIGGRSDLQAANPKMRGQIGEIMLFNTLLAPNDRIIVDNYLGAKYFQFTITQNLPATTTTSNGFTVTYTFSASQGSGHGFSYQWQVNGTNVPGATGSTYTTPILGPVNSNTTYDVVLTLPNGSTITSVTNTLFVLPAAPFVSSAGIPLWEAANPSNIVVIYDVAVDPVTGANHNNYILNNGATVLSAAIGTEPNKVVLTTTLPLSPWNANPGNYSLTVQNVQDLFGSTIVAGSIPVGLYPAGTALWLEGNTGVGIDSGGNPVFPGSTAVNQWNDQSGNAANLLQLFGTSLEPLLTTNYHGNPCIQFSGTNVGANYNGKPSATFLSSANENANDYPSLEITNDLSIFAVATFNTLVGSTNGEIVGKTGSTSANQPAPYDYYENLTPNAVLYRGDGTNNTQVTATNGPSLGVPHIVGAMQAGFTISHFLDGAPDGTGATSALSPYVDQGEPMMIGERNDITANRLNGQMFELIMVSSALDSNDVVSLNNYLASKYTIPTGTNAYPAITQQPVALTNVFQNSTLTVPAGLLGNPLAIQWYDTNGVAIAGQTSATLSVPNIQANDAYYLVATNIYGSVTSSQVVVNVLPPINSTPTNIVFSVTNNHLTLIWPMDHTGWQLQAQTNNVSVGINTNWGNVNGSTATNKVVIPINLTNGTVFYRLMYQ